jgi:hypothetical protein
MSTGACSTQNYLFPWKIGQSTILEEKKKNTHKNRVMTKILSRGRHISSIISVKMKIIYK